jgi:hypothetical protein
MKKNKSFLNYQKDLFDNILKLNGNKFMAGISLLMLNLGSKYLIMDLAEGTNQLLKLKIIRRITLFCLFFVATRNIIISILLSTGFIIFTQGLFNDKSKYCILPKNLKTLTIDKKDYEKAKEIVKNYEEQADNPNNKKNNNDLFFNIKEHTNKKNNYIINKNKLIN